MAQPISVPADVTLPELTFRGVLLGALICVIFTASNVFLGLKVGLTFSSAIPAAVISMSVLRLFKDANILKTTWWADAGFGGGHAVVHHLHPARPGR